MTTGASDFLEFARREALRYGGESMLFLRELLQNARDADASRVSVDIAVDDERETITVSDDGCGMDLEDARRFLLTLYASSKKRSTGAAGRFGVGFWSVLLFEPEVITVRSRSARNPEGWDLVLGAELDVKSHRRASMPIGTSVRLERRRRPGNLVEAAWTLVRRDARHLRQRLQPDELLEVRINGRPATEPMVPGEPGMSFRGTGLRGVVTLAAVPEVTVLAHGLRVLSVAGVDDLLLRPDARRRRRHEQPASGLSPRVVVDSDRLAVLMDRGDVAQDRALVDLARVIRAEIRRLCRLELDRLAPLGRWRRIVEALASRRRVLGFSLLGAAVCVLTLLAGSRMGERTPDTWAPTSDRVGPYVDRAEAYGGPLADTVETVTTAPQLRYEPVDRRPWLAAFRVSGIDDGGIPLRAHGDRRPAPATAGTKGLEVELVFESSVQTLRLPVPTGQAVDPETVRIDGRSVPLWLTAEDEPLVDLGDGRSGLLRYETVNGAVATPRHTTWPRLPTRIEGLARALRKVAPEDRVQPVIVLVREAIGGSNAGVGEGGDSSPFVASIAARGVDCDVINTVLAAALTEAGLNTRLAVGWVGADGAPQPGLHAWVEVEVGQDRWKVADASFPREEPGGSTMPATHDAGAAREGSGRWWPLLGFGAVALVAALGLAGLAKRRVRRIFKSARATDPGPLVESLIRDRQSWPGYFDAIRRPLIDRLDGGRVSLATVEQASAAGTLFAAGGHNPWAGRLGSGALIVDASTRAGRVVGSVYGAFDLDRWSTGWERAATGPFTCEVEAGLRRAGLDLVLRKSESVPNGIRGLASIDGAQAWVIVAHAEPEWRRCRELIDEDRDLALFQAAEFVVGSLPDRCRAAWESVAVLAKAALRRFDSGGRS